MQFYKNALLTFTCVLLCVHFASAQKKNCLKRYNAKIYLSCQFDSISVNYLNNPISFNDTSFSVKIENKGIESLKMSAVPMVTYEEERFPEAVDLYYKTWVKDTSGHFVQFNKHSANIDYVGDISEESHYDLIKPDSSFIIKKRLNPFHIHGFFNETRKEYRVQLFYRMHTPCGDFIEKSNYVYLILYKN